MFRWNKLERKGETHAVVEAYQCGVKRLFVLISAERERIVARQAVQLREKNAVTSENIRIQELKRLEKRKQYE